MNRDDMAHPRQQFHLYIVIPRRQVADIRIELEPRIVQVMCMPNALLIEFING